MGLLNRDNELRGTPIGGLLACADAADPIAAFRAMAPLPDRAQIEIDNSVIQVGLDRLVLVADLLAAGLTYDLPNWLGTLIVEGEKESRAGNAITTMLPGTRNEMTLSERSIYYVPVPCTWDRFDLNARTIAASQNRNQPLDTSMVSAVTRGVNERIEYNAWNGIGLNISFNSNLITAPGVLNHPDANTFSFARNEAWTVVTHTGSDILADVLGMIKVAHSDRMFGPYNLYIPTDYETVLDGDFKALSDLTIRQRLLEIGALNSIKTADMLPADHVSLIQMTNNVIDVINGQQPVPINWAGAGGWEQNFAVLACMVARVKSTYQSQSGIVNGTPT